LNDIGQKRRGESGFTLVELLVVMLILGILAAIAVPSFLDQRDKASDAQAKAGVRAAQTAMETYGIDNGGSYAGVGADGADLKALEEVLRDLTIQVASTPETYTVSVDSDTGSYFTISRDASGVVDLDCETRNEGGCPSDGNWGG
jgi:type IV pilus assembly protein PilA